MCTREFTCEIIYNESGQKVMNGILFSLAADLVNDTCLIDLIDCQPAIVVDRESILLVNMILYPFVVE